MIKILLDMIDLTAKLNTAAGVKVPDKETVKGKSTPVSKRVTNRSVTCSVELRDRLRVMAANNGISMQELLESWMRKELEAAGF